MTVFSFLTSNGIQRRETGKLVNFGQPGEHIEVQGVVSYTGPDGNLVVVHYTAGENGYQVVAPPVIAANTRVSQMLPVLLGCTNSKTLSGFIKVRVSFD